MMSLDRAAAWFMNSSTIHKEEHRAWLSPESLFGRSDRDDILT
jgi:hypothetical protein